MIKRNKKAKSTGLGSIDFLTPNCELFYKAFQAVPNISACATEHVRNNKYIWFHGCVNVNRRDFVEVEEIDKGRYMVCVNDFVTDNGEVIAQQRVFSYHRSLRRAIDKAKVITLAGTYPTPIEVYR